MKRWLLIVAVIITVRWLNSWFPFTPVTIRADSPTPTPLPPFDVTLPDDIMPNPASTGEAAALAEGDVLPIFFVPNDLTPHPLGLSFTNQAMQTTQRWYAEQLRGRTFSLAPAQLVIGTRPLTAYYGSCFPPQTPCDGFELWWPIFQDLANLGYPAQTDQILAVFFQQAGLGYTGLGSNNQFLFAPFPYLFLGDCPEAGCMTSLYQGVMAHELGHGFGLNHTLDDPPGAVGQSIMGVGYAAFPIITFLNTAANPERDYLDAHPLINETSTLTDGGFEDCLASWQVSGSQVACTIGWQHSGAAALKLAPASGYNGVFQAFTVQASQTYDLSGWLKITSQDTGAYDIPGQLADITVEGDYAYLAHGFAGLRLVNIANPYAPVEAGRLDTPGFAIDVAVNNNYAYVADQFSPDSRELRIIDVSNPVTPVEAGSYNLPWAAYGVAAAGDYVYVAATLAGLHIIDVSNPLSPTGVSSINLPSQALDVTVAGHYAYVAADEAGLRIINVANPAAPVEVGAYDTPGHAQAVAVAGGYAYVAAADHGLRIINITNPAAPIEVGSYDSPGQAQGIAVDHGHAYVADGEFGLAIIDVTNPTAPLAVGRLDTPASASSVAVDGYLVYLADYYQGLRIFNLKPANQVQLQIQWQSLAESGTVLETFEVANYTSPTERWEPFGQSVKPASNAVKGRLLITNQASDVVTYVDDLYLRPAQQSPPAPYPLHAADGDAVNSLHPTLKWSNVATAVGYRLQVAADSRFQAGLIDTTVTSPFYTVADGLAYNHLYYWHVRALNGAGKSGWSPTWRFIPRSASDYYNDEFEGTLNPAWSWIREDADKWRVSNVPGALRIDLQPGDLHQENNARNLLLRHTPPADFEVSTATGPLKFNQQQAGLLIYQDDDNYLSLMQSYNDGYQIEFRAEIDGVFVEQATQPMFALIPLKIRRTGHRYQGYYSVDMLTWQSLGQSVAVDWPSAQMGLAAFDAASNQPATAQFQWFRVATLPEKRHRLYLPLIQAARD